MIYTINKVNYKTFEKFEENKLPGRSYFIPFSCEEALRQTDIRTERYESDRVTVLSGDDWGFRYYPSAADVPELLDTGKTVFDTITVPSTWQRTGYEAPCYLNAQYQFDEKIPNLPENVPVGIYRKLFTVEETDKNYILTFLGAISSLDVYINGRFVGYSEGAHNTAEFNINSFLTQGENELICVVYKWSTATYLECQDMFRENGIFRDVYLTKRENAYLRDISVTYRRGEDGRYNMRLLTTVRGENAIFRAVLRDGEKELAVREQTIRTANDLTFENLAVTEWNAEQPKLYEVVVSLVREGETIECARQFIGFKRIEIDGDVFRFNGKKVKLKGVNHHDTTPDKGYVMTPAELERDVRLMKEYNVNAVRTSHYPPDPMFLSFCDAYGLYVVDEADIETHGCSPKPYGNIHLISNNLKWAGHYLDRVRRMYERDKNHPSITLWSLGNESGGYRCQDKCYTYLKDVSPEIPVHYEGVRYTKRRCYDVMSEMYTPYQKVGDIGAGKTADPAYRGKPFFLCEYAHAMGVGPGGLEDYMKAFYASDKLMGGCIWEWADHAVLHAEGPYCYTYGGDHGEGRHSGSFCVDGLFYPDRRPHTGALEMQAVYRPLRAREKQPGIYQFKNTNCFRRADYIEIRWELLEDGAVIASGAFIPNLEPGDVKPFRIAHPAPQDGTDAHMTFTYVNQETGALIAREQLELRRGRAAASLNGTAHASLQEDKETYTVIFQNGRAVFSKKSGRLEQYTVGEKDYLHASPQGAERGISPLIYRAPLDNDQNVAAQWEKFRLGAPIIKVKEMSARPRGNTVSVQTLLQLKAGAARTAMLVELNSTVDGDGAVLVEYTLKKAHPGLKDLPRFGMGMELNRRFDRVTYFGLGERENLSDLNAHTTVGVYSSSIAGLREPYIKPQESGFRTGIRWLQVEDEAGGGLRFEQTGELFSFEAAHFTPQQLAGWHHTEDVRDMGTTFVAVDGFLRGAGSASCGPGPGEEHILNTRKPHTYSFLMRPLKG